jgi:RNA polymerase sigma-54 factor
MELKQSLRLTQTLVMTPSCSRRSSCFSCPGWSSWRRSARRWRPTLLEQPDETADGNLDEKAPGEASLEAANAEPATTEALEAAPTPEQAVEVKGDSSPEIDWDAYFNSYQFNEPTTPSNKNNVATEDLPSFEANLVEREDLAGHLEAQLGFLKLNDAELRIASQILYNLDDDGYLKLPDVGD